MNVSNIRNCFGCGICATVCKKNAITIGLNKNGFYEPIVHMTNCVDCNMCVQICSFSHDDIALNAVPIATYNGWSKDEEIRIKCSSGGVGYEVGRYLIDKGYKACGVRYNVKKERAEHFVAKTEDEYIYSIGSKYIQSYTVDGFKQINIKGKNLVTGTPCQIDSFRRYIKKKHCEDNFVLMDFFCHSVPSMLMWKQYIASAEKKVGKLKSVSWRCKQTGWHDSWNMTLEGDSQLNSRLSKGDVFYKLFLGDFCCNPACQKVCRFKYDRSSADIRIGDAWGPTYANDEKGTSSIIVFTELGKQILCGSKIELISNTMSIVGEGQMRKNADKAVLAFLVMRLLRQKRYYSENVWRVIIKLESLLNYPRRVFIKIKRVFV